MGGGIIPAAINTAIGMAVPGLAGALIGAANTMGGHTLGSMARDALAPEGTPLGALLAIPGDIRGRIGEALSPITGGIGDVLSGAARDATTGLSNLLPDVTPPTSVPQAPPGVQPPASAVAVSTLDDEPFVGRNPPEDRQYAEIPPDIARRLSETASYGYRRVAESPRGLPEGAFGDPSFAQYRGGYFRESPAGSGEYHHVGPPGTSSVAQVYRREQIPEGSLIVPPGTQYADVFGVSRSDPSRLLEKQQFGLA
jgi:hypothetical protein